MRCYFLAKLENSAGVTEGTFQKWKERTNNSPTMTANTLATMRRCVIKNKKLSEQELAEIEGEMCNKNIENSEAMELQFGQDDLNPQQSLDDPNIAEVEQKLQPTGQPTDGIRIAAFRPGESVRGMPIIRAPKPA